MNTGKTVRKSGKVKYPTLINTFTACIHLLFFRQSAYFHFVLNSRTIFNLITIYLLASLVPYKSFLTGEINYFSFERLAENVISGGFYFLIFFLFVPNKNGWFKSFLRIFLAVEITSFLLPISLLLDGKPLMIFMGSLESLYIVLTSYSLVVLKRFGRMKAGAVGLTAYFGTIFLLILAS